MKAQRRILSLALVLAILLALLAVTVVGAIAFVMVEKRSKDALIPMDLFGNKYFVLCLLAACAIWPYRLCQWDAALYAYEDLGGARARSDRLEGFPRAADRDGDGMVYYIGEDAYREENPVDGGAYQTWRDQHLAGAEILPVRYYRLTEDIVSLLQ